MNAPFDLRLDKASFTRWLARQDRKYEWKEGRVVQMPNVTRDHANIVSNIVGTLRLLLDLDKWSVLPSDFGVEDEHYLRFPDVVIEPTGGAGKGRRADDAMALVEVLSASSVDTDLIEKVAEYTSRPLLQAYIVVSQDEAICWLWQRDPATGAFPARPVRIEGLDQSMPLPVLGLALPLAAVYRGVRLPG